MKCPLCNIEMRIVKSAVRFENDDTPDFQTKAYRVLTLKCRNPQCTGYETQVESQIK